MNQTLYLTGVLWPINDGFRTKIVPISQLLTILGGTLRNALPLITSVQQGIGVSRTVRFGAQLGPVILWNRSIRICNEKCSKNLCHFLAGVFFELFSVDSRFGQVKKILWSSHFFSEFMVGNHCTYILFRFDVVWWWTIRNQINENCELISEVEFKTSTRLSSSTKSRLDQDRFTIHAILSDIYEILHLTFKNIVIITIECTTQYPVVGSRSVFWSNKDREETDSPEENLYFYQSTKNSNGA